LIRFHNPQGVNLGAVDQELEATRLERRFELIHKGHVLARIGDEDSGFRLGYLRMFRICNQCCSSPQEALMD
jgi:hypothetical protein